MKQLPQILLLLLLLTSCTNKKLYDEEIIEELARGDFELPSAYSFLYLYVAVEGDQIGVTHIGQLHNIYKWYYQDRYSSFDEFVAEALNQALVFPPEHLEKINGRVTTISPRLKTEFEHRGLPYLLSKYFTQDTNTRYAVNREQLGKNELHGLLYFFFINRYRVTHDDYIGSYYVEPW